MKSYAESKTLWVAILTPLLCTIPTVREFVKLNPQVVASGVGLVFAILRLITSKKLGK